MPTWPKAKAKAGHVWHKRAIASVVAVAFAVALLLLCCLGRWKFLK